jgi:hypothetical protein
MSIFYVYAITLQTLNKNCLGENLRRQRDRADSEKAQALRDYDNLKKQKDEAVRELKELR